MGLLAGKVWGTTELLLGSALFEVHRLEIKANAECSFHKHNFKWNAFYVLEGELFIDVEKNDYQLTDITTLQAGQIATVRPGEFHKFRTGAKPCVALEVYYCEPLGADIIRRDVGSVRHHKARKR